MENIEGEFEEQLKTVHPSKLDKLCVTRWTVRGKCFGKILDNYEPLLQLWEESLKEDFDFETKSRIIGCKKQMKLFTFYFGLNLSKSLYLITDNLSKTLQKEKMSAIGGKEFAGLTVKILKNMRNILILNYFTKRSKRQPVKSMKYQQPCSQESERNQIIQFFNMLKETQSQQEKHIIQRTHFKQIYFEALDAIVNTINDRFDQPVFELFSQVEQLFLKSVKKQDVTDELKMVEKHFKNDYDEESLIAELQLLPTIFEEERPPINLEDVVKVIKSFAPEKRQLIQNVVTVIKIILTNGATSATPERSFSMLRRIKTWLRSRMSQKSLNSLSIMYDNKDLLDNVLLIDVANEFVGLQPDRKNAFGSFTVRDL